MKTRLLLLLLLFICYGQHLFSQEVKTYTGSFYTERPRNDNFAMTPKLIGNATYNYYGSTTILVGTDLSPHEKIRLHF